MRSLEKKVRDSILSRRRRESRFLGPFWVVEKREKVSRASLERSQLFQLTYPLAEEGLESLWALQDDVSIEERSGEFREGDAGSGGFGKSRGIAEGKDGSSKFRWDRRNRLGREKGSFFRSSGSDAHGGWEALCERELAIFFSLRPFLLPSQPHRRIKTSSFSAPSSYLASSSRNSALPITLSPL